MHLPKEPARTPSMRKGNRGKSERRFQALIEKSSDIIALINAQGQITYMSSTLTRLTGHLPEAFLGSHILALLHQEEQSLMRQLLAGVLVEPGKARRMECRVHCKDGSFRWFETTMTNFLHEPIVAGIVANLHDIAERKQTEQEREKLLQERIALLELTDEGIYGIDLQGHCTFINKAGAKMVGYTLEELLGKNMHDLIHHSYSDGTPYPERSCPIFQTLSTGRGVRVTNEVLWRKDGIAFPAEYSSHPVTINGAIQGAVVTFIDISERIEQERRKDEFISVASHELKTPVTSLKGFTQLLYRRFKRRGEEEALRFLGRMDSQLNRLTDLINDLLDISRIQAEKLEYQDAPFSLDPLVQEIVENVQATVETHQLLLENPANVSIFGDRNRIGQVLTNLLTNAIKYSPASESVIVRVESSGNEALVSVQDYGIGIGEDQQQKIFDRFYQVNNKDVLPSGLGIGLYFAHQIVKRHGGRIWVESHEGEGSIFRFTLPLFEG